MQVGAPQDIATAPAGEVDGLALVWLSLAPRAGDLGQGWLVAAIHSGMRTTVVANIWLIGPLTA